MTKIYKESEVEKHNTEKDVWCIYNGEVYNVTKFLSDHPGGEDVILDLAGKDITQAFEDIGHSDSAKETMRKYLIGKLEHSEKTVKESAKGGTKGAGITEKKASADPYLNIPHENEKSNGGIYGMSSHHIQSYNPYFIISYPSHHHIVSLSSQLPILLSISLSFSSSPIASKPNNTPLFNQVALTKCVLTCRLRLSCLESFVLQYGH